MSVQKMSYDTANEIFDLYCKLLSNLTSLRKYERYGYSDLKGYDIVDISNAMKLILAERLFNIYNPTDDNLKQLRKFAEEDGSGLFAFFNAFFPDDIKYKLRKLDPNDESEFLKYIQLTRQENNADMHELIKNEETPGSFLEYCIGIGISDSNYWGKVYKRIGISWESKNPKDRIFVLINNQINFIPNT